MNKTIEKSSTERFSHTVDYYSRYRPILENAKMGNMQTKQEDINDWDMAFLKANIQIMRII